MTVIPAQITFHGIDHSDAVETHIRERLAKLEQFHDGIIGCRVLIDMPHRHQHSGRALHVRIEISAKAGAPLVVNFEPSSDEPSKDDAIHVVNRAFEIARRQLQELARTQRGEVKTHA